MRVRSGSSPRRLDESEEPHIGHTLFANGQLNVFASDNSLNSESIYVRGSHLSGSDHPDETRSAEASAPIPKRPGVIVSTYERDELNHPDSGWERLRTRVSSVF